MFQDQKQTDSIQVLQSQLENVTRLMLNLTTTVGQLQREVGYLLLIIYYCFFADWLYSDEEKFPTATLQPVQILSCLFFILVLKAATNQIMGLKCSAQ